MLYKRFGMSHAKAQAYDVYFLAAYAGAGVVVSIPVGIIADRTKNRKTPFMSGLFAMMVGTVMLSIFSSIPLLLLARILQGSSAAVVWTVGFAMVLDTVGPENLGKVVGTVSRHIPPALSTS
jgi:MFS family permease